MYLSVLLIKKDWLLGYFIYLEYAKEFLKELNYLSY